MDSIKKITIVDVEKQAQWGKPTGRNYVRPTQTERAHIALNCYEPGVNDELHCHPGSDHTFFVVEGECTMKGLKDDEEFKLTKHQAVHVPARPFLPTEQHRHEPFNPLSGQHRTQTATQDRQSHLRRPHRFERTSTESCRGDRELR